MLFTWWLNEDTRVLRIQNNMWRDTADDITHTWQVCVFFKAEQKHIICLLWDAAHRRRENHLSWCLKWILRQNKSHSDVTSFINHKTLNVSGFQPILKIICRHIFKICDVYLTDVQDFLLLRTEIFTSWNIFLLKKVFVKLLVTSDFWVQMRFLKSFR